MTTTTTRDTMNAWQKKLHEESISRAIAARKLKDEGWSDGKLMDHFGVVETTIKRWLRLVDEGVSDGDSQTS